MPENFDLNLNYASPFFHCATALYAYIMLRTMVGDGLAAGIPLLISFSSILQPVRYELLFGILHTAILFNLAFKCLN